MAGGGVGAALCRLLGSEMLWEASIVEVQLVGVRCKMRERCKILGERGREIGQKLAFAAQVGDSA